MPGEKAHHIYTTYKNTVMPHGRNIYAKAPDMENATMCAYTQSDNALPHWKFVLRCCDDCPRVIFLTNLKKEEQNPQLGFRFITSLDVVLLMVEFH